MKILRTVGDKGQVTIPKEVRDLLGIEHGDVVQLELLAVYPRGSESAQEVSQDGATFRVPVEKGVDA